MTSAIYRQTKVLHTHTKYVAVNLFSNIWIFGHFILDPKYHSRVLEIVLHGILHWILLCENMFTTIIHFVLRTKRILKTWQLEDFVTKTWSYSPLSVILEQNIIYHSFHFNTKWIVNDWGWCFGNWRVLRGSCFHFRISGTWYKNLFNFIYLLETSFRTLRNLINSAGCSLGTH